MIQSSLPLAQRAQLTGLLLARSTANGAAAEVANAYDSALDQLVPKHGKSPESEFLQGVRSSVGFTNQHWMCASRKVNNPAIRTAAFKQALQVLAQGPIGSVPAAVASVVLGTAERLPGAVGKDAAPYIQTHLLDDSSKYLQARGGDNVRFLLQMAEQTSEAMKRPGEDEAGLCNRMRMDALGVIATLEEPATQV